MWMIGVRLEPPCSVYFQVTEMLARATEDSELIAISSTRWAAVCRWRHVVRALKRNARVKTKLLQSHES